MGRLHSFILSSPRRLAMPVLSFPGASLTGATVRNIVEDADRQTAAQLALHDKFSTSFFMSAMDLSVEAEEFGSEVRIVDAEIPTVTARLISDQAGVTTLRVPTVGGKRTRVTLDTVRKLAAHSQEIPVLASMIGPFSLAGRIFGVSEALQETATDPDTVLALVEKTTSFLSAYALELKKAGAWGILIAEPTAGLLSPPALAKFSSPFIRRIVEAVEDETCEIVLHNCGAKLMHLKNILDAGPHIFHFGKPMDLPAALSQVSHDIVLCGNLDPAAVFVNANPAEVRSAAGALLAATQGRRNFVISSGCDIPPDAPMANITSFFKSLDPI
jgi:uroporphyrinogen decarboxylase